MPAPDRSTLFIGQQLFSLKEIDSTNSYAMRMVREGNPPEGAVVITENQTNGRGQRGTIWNSVPGRNITCSVILKPQFLQVNEQFDLTRGIALAVFDTIHEFLPELNIRIKWPNDIYADHKKIAGILVENVIHGSTLQTSIAGIGINVNQSGFASELTNATSVVLLLGKEVDLMEFRAVLFSHLEARYLQLRAGLRQQIRTDYFQKLYRRNEAVRYTDFRSIFNARILDVTQEGRLVLQKEDDSVCEFNFKEIAMI